MWAISIYKQARNIYILISLIEIPWTLNNNTNKHKFKIFQISKIINIKKADKKNKMRKLIISKWVGIKKYLREMLIITKDVIARIFAY
jgi:hypothetical protein